MNPESSAPAPAPEFKKIISDFVADIATVFTSLPRRFPSDMPIGIDAVALRPPCPRPLVDHPSEITLSLPEAHHDHR